MARAPGIYVPLDVHFMRDPRIRKAGPEAETLYLRSLAYAKGAETDGRVWDYDLDVIGVGLPRLAARVGALVRVGLWESIEDGWYIAGWLKWNTSTADLKAQKAAQRNAAEQTTHQVHHIDKGQVNAKCHLCLSSL